MENNCEKQLLIPFIIITPRVLTNKQLHTDLALSTVKDEIVLITSLIQKTNIKKMLMST